MTKTNIAYSINFDNEKINVRELYGEYFRVDSDLEIKPSMKMENKMEEIIEDYLGDTENKDIKETMVKKLFTSRKPKVSKERKTIKDIIAVIEERQEELTNILNSTSASLYNKEDYVYDYVGWVMKHKIYDITGEEYDKEKYEKGKEEARKQIDIEVTKGAYEQLKTLKKEIQDEDVTSSLFVLIKRIEESKETFKSLVPMKGEVVAGAKLINYQLELERYPVDTS